MPEETQFRTEHFQEAPRGWRVRTITHPSGHEVRLAFPKGPRKRGSGRLVSILHPHENPGCGLGRNPVDWESKWDEFRSAVADWICPNHRGTEAQSNPLSNGRRNYTEEVKTSDGKTVFVDVLGSGEKWMAEGYPVIAGKIRRVGKPRIARGRSESEAYDNLIDLLERNPKGKSKIGSRKAVRNLDEIDRAADLAAEFKGSPAEEVREISLSAKTRDDYAHLGWMVQEVFQPPFDHTEFVMKDFAEDFWKLYDKTKDSVKTWRELAKRHGATFIVLDTEGDEIELASSADRKQLFFLGGRQAEITKQFENFGVKPNHDLVDLGNMMALTYLAKKDHAGDTEETPYTHLFGEEGGIVPRASYDTLNQRVLVSGGTYHLDDAQAGIRN